MSLRGRRPASVIASCLLAGVVVLAQSAPQAPPPQQPQVFRSRTTVVPIDVRVLDRNGQPIRDLTAADFTVLENGRPQKVDYFSAHALTPGEPGPPVALRPGDATGGSLAPQNRRLFLILLGRGRLQEPSKGVDATLRFIRQRLLPQDQVAVMAWNRATDFSTDHQRVAEVVERFKAHHEAIEALLVQQYGGLSGLYSGPRIPAAIQVLIDRVFGGPTANNTREVLPGAALTREEADARRNIELLQRSDLEAFRLFGGTDVTLANAMLDPTLPMDFEDYVQLNRQTMLDVGNLYAGIEYLRYIDGEKHLILVTEQGFSLPRAEHDRDLAAMASDARVAIDTFQTGGVATRIGPDGFPIVTNGFQLTALREISEFTGGQVAVSKRGDDAYDRILSSTEFGYLLGYTSNGPAPNGRLREIKVEVKRRGAVVSHRKAYLARSAEVRFDPRQSLATTRLVAAAAHGYDIKDLRMDVKLTDVREGDTRFVDAQITVDADRVVFARAGDRFLAAMNLAILTGDYYNANTGELWQSRDIRIPASQMEEIRKNGLVISVRVPVRQRPVHVKVLLYDYGSDLIGSLMKRMR